MDMVTDHTLRKSGFVVVKATTLALVVLSIHLQWVVLLETCLFFVKLWFYCCVVGYGAEET
jgi:hypothetical protein